MAAAMGARFLRAIDATCSAIDAEGKSSSMTYRFKATEPISPSTSAGFRQMSGRADLEIDRAGEGVGDRRPLLAMVAQRIDLALRNALAFHVDLDANVREADRLLADVAGAPDGGDVEIALEFQFELVDGPTAMHGIGVKANGEAGTQCRKRGLGGIGRGVVTEKARRVVDDVWRKVADVVGVAELAFGHRLAFQGLDDLRVGLAVDDELFQPLFIDRGEAAGERCFLSDRGH